MCTVKDEVWMGFEIGYLLVFDTATKRPCAQAWLQQYTAILSILHVAALQRVYIGFENGSVLAFDDDLASAITTITPARIKLLPICEYHNTTQTSACLLAVPQVNSCSIPQSQHYRTSATSFEIWVGQKAGLITILDAEKLTVLKFLQNTVDLSRTPSYVAYLTYANLVCSISTEPAASSSNGPPEKTSGGVLAGNVVAECVSVYGALYHGQYITRWSAESKTVVQSFNCEKHMEGNEGNVMCSLVLFDSIVIVGARTLLSLASEKLLVLHTHTHTHTCMHTHTHTRMHMHAHTHTRMHMHAHTHAHAHTYTCHMQMHTTHNIHTRTRAHTHTHMHTHTHACTHAHTECCISSLHFSNLTLYVGLTCGKVLILDAHSFNCLCTLSCYRNQVKSLFCIDLAILQQQDLDMFSLYEREMERLSSSGSTPSVLHSTNPSPIHLSDRCPSLSSIQTVNANSRQLLSFGTGFRSYFDGPESKQYWDSGFLLIWESEHWNGDS